MKRFSVHIPYSIKQSLVHIPLPWRDRLWQAIDSLTYNPHYGITMLGKYKDKYKVRVLQNAMAQPPEAEHARQIAQQIEETRCTKRGEHL